MTRLPREFFERDALAVAPELVGCRIVRALPDGTENSLVITETEAYCGELDSACHAYRGKTKRNAPLYMRGGVFYVYLFIVTRSSFRKCIGIGKVDNLALLAVMKKQETQSILFFPNCGYDTRSSSPIAAADINYDYNPKVGFCIDWLDV